MSRATANTAPAPQPPVETSFDAIMADRARAASAANLAAAAANASLAMDQWRQLPGGDSARVLIRLAALFEGHSSSVAGLAPALRAMAREAATTGLAPVPSWWVGLSLPGF